MNRAEPVDAGDGDPGPESSARRSGRWVVGRITEGGILPVLLLVLVVTFAVGEPRFLSVSNIVNILRQSVFLLLVTLGQMTALVSGKFDLSVGSVVALSGVVSASVMTSVSATDPVAMLLGIAAGVLVGVVFGLVNSLIVGIIEVPAFIGTLGMSSIGLGAALMLTDGTPISGLPDGFTSLLGSGTWLGLPMAVWVAVLITAMLYVVLYWTALGRNVFAVGGNPQAAKLAGINVHWVRLFSLTTCSALSAVAGILLLARVGSGEAGIGETYVLLSIAAAVLGGTSIFGGEARIGFVVLGVVFVGALTNGMNLTRIPSYVQELTLGAVLIFAVIVDQYRRRRVGTS